MRTFVLPVLIGFGDCDPAGIVFYPNFYRWFDTATHQMWRSAGYDIKRVRRETGLIAGPLVETGASYRAPATHGETVEVHSRVSEWGAKTFRVAHEIRRGPALLVEGFEVRIFARPHPEHPGRLQAVPVPEDFRQLFGAP